MQIEILVIFWAAIFAFWMLTPQRRTIKMAVAVILLSLIFLISMILAI